MNNHPFSSHTPSKNCAMLTLRIKAKCYLTYFCFNLAKIFSNDLGRGNKLKWWPSKSERNSQAIVQRCTNIGCIEINTNGSPIFQFIVRIFTLIIIDLLTAVGWKLSFVIYEKRLEDKTCFKLLTEMFLIVSIW